MNCLPVLKTSVWKPGFLQSCLLSRSLFTDNLWSGFAIPPEADDPKKQWRTGESLVGKEPLDSQEKQKMDPTRFATTLQQLVSMEPTVLKQDYLIF